MRIKRLTESTLVAQALRWLAGAVCHRRRWFIYPQLFLFVAAVLYTAWHLELDTSRAHLVGPNKSYQQIFETFKKEFPDQDDIVVVIESENRNKNRQFVERLGLRLESETNLFRDVFFKGDLKTLGPKALLFVPEPDLADLKKSLSRTVPFIQRFSRTTNLISLFDMVNEGFRTAKREQNAQNQSMMKALPALERIVDEASASLKGPDRPLSPGINALLSQGDGNGNGADLKASEQAEQQSYVTFADGKIYLLTTKAIRAECNKQALQRLRVLADQTKTEVPGLNVGITGEIVLEHDEMSQSQSDTALASLVALAACALIFIYGYHETGRPVKATLCLIIGVGYTLAFATWAVGHLNVLTITFVPILIGLAIDDGVHLISRFEEELGRGRTEQEALTKAMVYTGQGVFTGAFTMAGAFGAMTLTHFRGIQEMGIICGGGLLICLVPMLTMLPALLLHGRQSPAGRFDERAGARRARIESVWLQRPVLATCLTLGLCALAATQLPKIYFDYNLLHMQSAGLPAVEFEKKLLDSANKSLLFGAVIAGNEQEASQMAAGLTHLPAIAGVESITKYLSGDQLKQLQLVREIKGELEPICFAPLDPEPVNLAELSRTLYSLYGYLGAATAEVQRQDSCLARQFSSLRQAINTLHKQMLRGADAQLVTNSLKLGAFQRALFNDIHQTFQALKTQECDSPLQAQDLPRALRARFVGVTGKYLLMVYPRKDLRNRDNQHEFIQQVRTVYPSVSGTPVQLYYYTELLKRSYEEAARYSLVAIVFLVLCHFRSLLCLGLAMVPVAVGSVWLGGILGYFGVPLNPANIMTLPLVIGIGVTNGIQVLNRYAEEQTPNILARSTGKAVLVSGLTSMAGFGSLILAKHQGIQSLGYVMSCGLATCMIAGLGFLPALLSFLNRRPELPKGRNVDRGMAF